MAKWKCKECKSVVTSDELLTAPNPFAKGYEITGCPNCKEVESMFRACDAKGCVKESSCGYPSGKDYFFTCGEHYHKL